jgi:hypothetical protein
MVDIWIEITLFFNLMMEFHTNMSFDFMQLACSPLFQGLAIDLIKIQSLSRAI